MGLRDSQSPWKWIDFRLCKQKFCGDYFRLCAHRKNEIDLKRKKAMNQIRSKEDKVNEKQVSRYLIADHFQALLPQSFMC